MTRLAKPLPVLSIPKQRQVPFVRPDVINHVRQRLFTDRTNPILFFGQELQPCRLPRRIIVQMMPA